MNRGPAWAAVDALADAWRLTSAVQIYAAQLPRNDFVRQVTQGGGAGHRRDPVAEALEHVNAGFGSFMINPFLLPSLLPAAASISPEVDLNGLHQANPEWFDAASRIEAAHRLTIDWLRSRLPRYPLLPAPQLAQNTSYTTHEYTRRITWTGRAARSSLQLSDVPSAISRRLGADNEQQRSIETATRNVHIALANSVEWKRFLAADANLTEPARTELMACRRRIRARLTDEAQDAHEPRNSARRDQFRTEVTQDDVMALTGATGEYAQSFAVVDTLIEFAAGTIFSQLTCYPTHTLAISDLSVEPGPPRRVRFTSSTDAIVTPCGSVVWLDDQLIEDAVHLDGQTMSFGLHGFADKFTGVVLDGSRILRPDSTDARTNE